MHQLQREIFLKMLPLYWHEIAMAKHCFCKNTREKITKAYVTSDNRIIVMHWLKNKWDRSCFSYGLEPRNKVFWVRSPRKWENFACGCYCESFNIAFIKVKYEAIICDNLFYILHFPLSLPSLYETVCFFQATLFLFRLYNWNYDKVFAAVISITVDKLK